MEVNRELEWKINELKLKLYIMKIEKQLWAIYQKLYTPLFSGKENFWSSYEDRKED